MLSTTFVIGLLAGCAGVGTSGEDGKEVSDKSFYKH
jgi:hypothetical protein